MSGRRFADLPPVAMGSAAASVMTAAHGGDGPARIIEASRFVELYDEELDCQVSDLGIHTVEETVSLVSGDKVACARRLEEMHRRGTLPVIVGEALPAAAAGMMAARAAFPEADLVLLSGTVPPPVILATLAEAVPGALVWLAGLKSPPPVAPPGLRLLPGARGLHLEDPARAWEEVGPEVYLSINPDVFEPSVLPTPYNLEPGGLDWWSLTRAVGTLLGGRRLVGLAVAGHQTASDIPVADFTLAKLIYKILGLALCRGREPTS